MGCVPTPVGERVWVFLRPGLTLDAIQTRIGQIAVACWADTAIAMAASERNSAWIRLDIKRRDALTGKVLSPLLGRILPGAPAKDRDTTRVPTALDLPDITAAEVTPERPAPSRADKKPAAALSVVPDTASDDDVTDWL